MTTRLESLSNFIMMKSSIFMILFFFHQNSQAIIHESGILKANQTQQNVEQFKGQPRLPKFAIPHNYNLSISVDFSNLTFSGEIEITIDIISPTKYLVLNLAELVVEQNSIWFGGSLGCNGEGLKHPSIIVEVEEDETLIIGFDDILPIGKGILGIRYSGILNDHSRGLFRSFYEQDGEMQTMVATQFQPTDARRCFPCWDEPALKATFKIALEVPSNLVALSNMPAISEKHNGLVKTIYFQESPIMSTYLVAFVVGSLEYIEANSPDGLKIRVYTFVGKSDTGKFALDLAVKTLDLCKRYFSIPYVLPKLDMVGVPDLQNEGMENYGLITYREEYLLYDELLSFPWDKKKVAETVTHELAHQWLGNLVTMDWWTDIWMNEAFATWMSYSVTNDFFPEWNMWIQLLDDTLDILELDAFDEYRPIQVNITYGNNANDIFDLIIYNKGAIVIRMLQSYLGDKSFQKSLDAYLKRYSYTNAKSEDLWNVFQEETKEPFKDMMNSWTKQKGYPLVNVMIKENVLEINQSHFLLDGSFSDCQWIIPITFSYGSYDIPKAFLLNSKSAKLNLTDQENQENSQTSWIKLNTNQVGLYKVQYDNELTTRLRNAIQANQLSGMDKYGLLEDYFLLCKATKQTLSSFLSLLNAYQTETDPLILRRIGMISHMIVDLIADARPELSNNIKLFFIKLLKSPAKKLGWDTGKNEFYLNIRLRRRIFVDLALLGDNKTINEGIKRLHSSSNNISTLVMSSDIDKAAYISIMQMVSTTNKFGYEFLLKLYRENDNIVKSCILASIATCPDSNIIPEFLNFLLSSEVSSHDVSEGVSLINTAGREFAWTWLKENWDEKISKQLSDPDLRKTISSIVKLFGTSEKAIEISNFFKSRSNPSISNSLRQSLKKVLIKERWIQSVKNELTLGDTLKDLVRKGT